MELSEFNATIRRWGNPMVVSGSVGIQDGANLDAFSRLRVSQGTGLFDCQFTYNLRPLLFEQLTANGGGGTASIAHDATNRCATMTFTNALTGAYSYMQSFEHIPYQPGKGQLAFLTFSFIEAKADVLKFVGLSTRSNGIELQLNGTSGARLVLYSDTDVGDETVTQANWNIDTMDGRGDSRINIDWTKSHILVIDYQALYVGRVRVGFDIDGVVYYVHQFTHANEDATPYIQTATLPVRCGMSATATVSTTMRFICCSVISEGGTEDTSGSSFSVEGTVTASSGARTHILSVRPKTTFNSIANRIKFALDSVEVLVTGTNPIYWELCLGQAISGTTTYNDVNATYSGFEYNTAGTISGSPALVIASGYVNSSATNRGAVSRQQVAKYPITLDASGAVRANGTLTLIVTGIGGTSACRAAFNWREIR